MSCCTDFEKRGRYLFSSLRSTGCKAPAFCPWCGKGVTAPVRQEYSPLTAMGAGPLRAKAALQAKDWPKGAPECPNCKGQGWVLKRIGCCQIKPTPCSCLAKAAPPG